MVLPVRIELTASPLPRECSTTELRQRSRPAEVPVGTRRRGPSDSGSGPDCKPNLDAGPPGYYIGRIMDGSKGKPGAGKPDRARQDKGERLAEALRENLRKRKAQLRSRAQRGAGKTGIRPENDTDSSEKR